MLAANQRNGVCTMNKTTGKRNHEMRVVVDQKGRPVSSCVKCGMMPLEIKHEKN